jgi:hypothetical protein
MPSSALNGGHLVQEVVGVRLDPHVATRLVLQRLHQVMKAAGDEAGCIAYLMGYHVIAERMFRHQFDVLDLEVPAALTNT